MKDKSIEVEQRYGKRLKTLLPEIIERTGSVTAAAREMGVSQGSVSLWLKWNGLRIKTIVVPAEPEPSQ